MELTAAACSYVSSPSTFSLETLIYVVYNNKILKYEFYITNYFIPRSVGNN